VTVSLYQREPEGNHVELQVGNFPLRDEATGYIEGLECDAIRSRRLFS